MTNNLDVDIVLLDEKCMPEYAKYGDAGFDCFSASVDTVLILPNHTESIPLGFKIAVPLGFEMQVRPKSGLAAKFNLTIQNTPGTVDSGFRDEVKALVRNEGKETYRVEHGKKICQGVLAPIMHGKFQVKNELGGFDRGGGFGSTGV